ncbi:MULTISPECIES: phosphatidylserine decarboxylase [Pseudonocardia]|uniref:Phosphatidylserine decarboxylase proenzyme n=2 Tax=Pseudonocardia TaxID=1847 RepID=A0A1Y2NA02_PSEAH|nr:MULTISPECIES: phosphatidylserine decarboxylase [Pseudonocardia]OSY43999.1 phosphatidylserine decarboxylase [Pseudonocardia autotrophica]TDN74268.1 phosphatidylserine decarboxylase [Pseudonocardia autotrophica]BBG05032.1 phosphatidylserine decarboxylase proenzyme [Pseudonocardia autotrophica]GEC27979.1 phosphatidylserine decarboxylase proenzyme [Pseudonocardia saturnea]
MAEGTGTSPTHIVRLVRDAIPPMHPGGRPIVAAVALVAAGVRALSGRGALPGLLATGATALFFRDPVRTPTQRPGAVLAPADGTVATVTEVVPPAELDLPRVPHPRVSIFLTVLDVHVQWVPVHGRVVGVRYEPGRFLSADLDKASEDNERNAITFHAANAGFRVGVVQIAGLLARRIVCGLSTGDEVAAGERFGLIRFGSRVDTYLPPGTLPLVRPGQRTVGAETVLGVVPAEG